MLSQHWPVVQAVAIANDPPVIRGGRLVTVSDVAAEAELQGSRTVAVSAWVVTRMGRLVRYASPATQGTAQTTFTVPAASVSPRQIALPVPASASSGSPSSSANVESEAAARYVALP